MFVSSRKQSMVPLDKRLQWRNVTKSEPWHIQNPDLYRTLEYSEPCQTSTMDHFRQNS